VSALDDLPNGWTVQVRGHDAQHKGEFSIAKPGGPVCEVWHPDPATAERMALAAALVAEGVTLYRDCTLCSGEAVRGCGRCQDWHGLVPIGGEA
jgi:hypothetical protein